MKQFFILLFLVGSAFSFGQETINHKVISGETVYGIAQKYQVKEKDIWNNNPEIKKKTLQIGMVLKIPNKAPQSINLSKIELPKTYTIRKGDSYYAIAKKFKISIRQLIEANPSVNPNILNIGTELKLEKDKKATETSVLAITPEGEIDQLEEAVYQDLIHVVKKGETLYSIAKSYHIPVDSIKSINPNLKNNLPEKYQLLIKKGAPSDQTIEERTIEIEETENQSTETENIEKDETETTLISADIYTKRITVIEKAKEYLGTRYRYGGRSLSGIDCSGLMCEAFEAADITLPRTSAAQATAYKKIKKKKAQEGDLIYFITRGKRISHVGLIVEVTDDSEIKFIHASSSSGVIVSSLNESYYAKRFAHINRVLN